MNGEFQDYANLAGNSGVKKYGLLEDGSMLVLFKDGSVYIYPFILNKKHIEAMLLLASFGRGLATYISRNKPLGVRAALVFGIELGASNDDDDDEGRDGE